MATQSSGDRSSTKFAELASQRHQGFASEFLAFLNERKKWWLAPILVLLLLLGLLIVLGGSGAAPFIYTLF